MIAGSSQWDEQIIENMIEQKKIGRTITTYKNLPKNLYYSLLDSSKKHPNKVAIIDDNEREYTYTEFLKHVNNFAAFLIERQINKGDHVAILLPTSIEYCICFFALNKIGAISVLIPTKYKENEIESLLKRADVKNLIVDKKYSKLFLDLNLIKIYIDLENKNNICLKYCSSSNINIDGCSSNDALIIFTSGTTSKSKGVVITNYNTLHSVETYKRTLDINSKDVLILPIPIYLITGLIAILGLGIHCGATVCLNKIFNSKRVLDNIIKYKVSFIHASPVVYLLLLKQKNLYTNLPSLKKMACGAGNMPPPKIKELHDWIPNAEFRTIYGLTETTSPATIYPCSAFNHKYIGSVGIPIPGTYFKIIDDKGEELEPNQRGEILIKGSVVLDRYYKQETSSFKNDWLNTGDIGYFNEAGFLYITDRKKDMINRGGEKIYSLDVENAIYEIDGVQETTVFGISNDLYGEVVIALVEKCTNAAGDILCENMIKTKLLKKLAKYEIPKNIYFVNFILKSKNGKINKKILKEKYSKKEFSK
jgi:fatty-acyl-CoA synthase/long-chain acyl-CoA synthetase